MKDGKKLGSGRKPTRAMLRKAAVAHVQGNTATRAMQLAGYAATTAGHKQKVLTDNPVFQEQVGQVREALLKKEKKIFEKVANVIVAGLGAMETKFFQHEGEVVETRDVISWSERRQYAELISRLFGEFYPKEDVSKRSPVTVNQIFQIVVDARRERGLEI